MVDTMSLLNLLKKLNKEDGEIALRPTQYRKIGSAKFIDISSLDEQDNDVISSIYYKEVPIERNGICETLIVTYSPKYKRYQRNIRNEQIKRAQTMISMQKAKFKKTERIQMIQLYLLKKQPLQKMVKLQMKNIMNLTRVQFKRRTL